MKKISIIITLGCLLGLNMPLSAQSTGTVNGHEYVDLALPSGLKWATCNVGAKTPEASGNCYSWGETKTKDEYNNSNCLTYDKEMDDISGNAQYDVAAANWGEGWRLPTNEEMQELIDCCTWEWTKQNGVKGYNVTGPNGNSIFLPTTGYKSGSTFSSETCGTGYYWSSTPRSDRNDYSYYLSFDNSYSRVDNSYRSIGHAIRPVCDIMEKPIVLTSIENYTDLMSAVKTYVSSAEITERGFYWGTNAELSEADNKVVLENAVGYKISVLMNLTANTTYYVKAYAANESGTSYSDVVSFTTLEKPVEYEYVDLGLPNGLKWATHNIGATTPEEYGNYYTWGEVLTKETYTPSNSETYGESMSDISGNAQYDAATFNWGGEWRMPTYNEMCELIDNCTWTWTTQNGVNGYKVASKVNANSIFLPAAGCRSGASLHNAGSHGYYWSSTPCSNDGAEHLSFYSSNHCLDYIYRYFGRTVRPVRE